MPVKCFTCKRIFHDRHEYRHHKAACRPDRGEVYGTLDQLRNSEVNDGWD